MCVAGALNDTLCIWRVKDGVTVTETFPELITTLQWKEGQRDSETPLLVVGLVGGDLVMVEVMGAHVNMSPSLQLTRLEHFGRGEREGIVRWRGGEGEGEREGIVRWRVIMRGKWRGCGECIHVCTCIYM